MKWEVIDGIFIKRDVRCNEMTNSLKKILSPFHEHSIYIRGSMIEQSNPHYNADMDIYILHKDKNILKKYTDEVLHKLSHFNRAIDIHVIPLHQLANDIPNRLLLSTSSIHIAGDEIEFQPVASDEKMLASHWKVYNPEFAPDIMYSTVKSRVCAMKNLTRCFGLLQYSDGYGFTRNINECLEFAKTVDEITYNNLINNWEIVDFKVPMELKEIKRYLKFRRSQIKY
jgi:hypothetical protein